VNAGNKLGAKRDSLPR